MEGTTLYFKKSCLKIIDTFPSVLLRSTLLLGRMVLEVSCDVLDCQGVETSHALVHERPFHGLGFC